MGKLTGKTALITGGSSGFGEAAALLWAEEGAEVAIADVNEDAGKKTAEKIRSRGGESMFLRADVSNPADAERMVTETVKRFGKLDILFNNAGILGPRSDYVVDLDYEDAQKLVNVNILGVYLGTKYAVPEMIKAGGGSIITTGSDSAFLGNRGLSVYCATKGAVLAFSRVIAMEYAEEGIRANTVSPGAGKTPMHRELYEEKTDVWAEVEAGIPMKRACAPEDIARAALFFASDDSSYITGANLMVDGGWTAKGL